MPRKNLGEIKTRFIAQIAEAERRVDEAKAEQERNVAKARITLEEAKTAFELTVANSGKDLVIAEAHLAGLKAALTVFDGEKKATAAPTS